MSMPHSRSSPGGALGYQDENDINLHIPYVFGSSRPRDLSYLDFLPAKLRVYNSRLRSSVRAKDEPTLSDYLRQVRGSPENRRHRDRSVDSASRYYVFGSSTPRDLSYLERIPWEYRIYDVKLGSGSGRSEKRSKTTSFSSTGSGGNGRGARRRTSSLNLLNSSPTSPSNNGGGKVEHTTSRRLTRSAQENATAATSINTKPIRTQSSHGNKSKSSTRSPSNTSQSSSQKTPIAKPKPATNARQNGSAAKTPKIPLTSPIQIHCSTGSPIGSMVHSREPTTVEASSPTSDEFYIVPSIALKSDTDSGLIEHLDNGDHSVLKTVEEIHRVVTKTEMSNSGEIGQRKMELIHQEITRETTTTQQMDDLVHQSSERIELATSQHVDNRHSEPMAIEHGERHFEEEYHSSPRHGYDGRKEPTSPPPIIVVDESHRPASAEERHHGIKQQENGDHGHGHTQDRGHVHVDDHAHDHAHGHHAQPPIHHEDHSYNHGHDHHPNPKQTDSTPSSPRRHGHDHDMDREVQQARNRESASSESPRSRGSSITSQ